MGLGGRKAQVGMAEEWKVGELRQVGSGQRHEHFIFIDRNILVLQASHIATENPRKGAPIGA